MSNVSRIASLVESLVLEVRELDVAGFDGLSDAELLQLTRALGQVRDDEGLIAEVWASMPLVDVRSGQVFRG